MDDFDIHFYGLWCFLAPKHYNYFDFRSFEEMWCLTPLSTIFHNISVISVNFICGGNRDTGENHRPVAHNVVSSTPRHERDSNSQLEC